MAWTPDGNVTKDVSIEPKRGKGGSWHIERKVDVFLQASNDPMAALPYLPPDGEHFQGDDGLEHVAVVTSMGLEAEDVRGQENLGAGEVYVVCIVHATITYSYDPQTGGGAGGGASFNDEFTVDSTTEMGHITHVRKRADQRVWNDSDVAAQAESQAIGIKDDEIEGVDIHVPAGAFEVRRWYDVDDLTAAKLAAWDEIKCCMNSNVVSIAGKRNYFLGELLYLGYSVTFAHGSSRVLVIHKLKEECTATLDVQMMGGVTRSILKLGWEYMWQQPGRRVTQSSGDPAKTTVRHGVAAAFIAQVYKQKNFAQLELNVEL